MSQRQEKSIEIVDRINEKRRPVFSNLVIGHTDRPG
jgi:hypothetical protein